MSRFKKGSRAALEWGRKMARIRRKEERSDGRKKKWTYRVKARFKNPFRKRRNRRHEHHRVYKQSGPNYGAMVALGILGGYLYGQFKNPQGSTKSSGPGGGGSGTGGGSGPGGGSGGGGGGPGGGGSGYVVNPNITVSLASSGFPDVAVSGSGFTENSTATLYSDHSNGSPTAMATVNVDSNGNFATQMVSIVIQGAQQFYDVYATDNSTGKNSTFIQVNNPNYGGGSGGGGGGGGGSPSLNPAISVSIGSMGFPDVNIQGSGFTANGAVKIYSEPPNATGGTIMGEVGVSGSGTFSVTNMSIVLQGTNAYYNVYAIDATTGINSPPIQVNNPSYMPIQSSGSSGSTTFNSFTATNIVASDPTGTVGNPSPAYNGYNSAYQYYWWVSKSKENSTPITSATQFEAFNQALGFT